MESIIPRKSYPQYIAQSWPDPIPSPRAHEQAAPDANPIAMIKSLIYFYMNRPYRIDLVRRPKQFPSTVDFHASPTRRIG